MIIIVITGLTLAFSDTSGGFRWLIQIVFGMSIAFAARSFFLTFFSSAVGRWSDGGSHRGFEVPLHRALTETVPLAALVRRGRAPSLNGALAAAVVLGLQLWLAELVLWFIGHGPAVYAACLDPQSPQVLARHVKRKALLDA